VGAYEIAADAQRGWTRRQLLVQGSLAFAAVSPLAALGKAAVSAAATSARACVLGAFANADNGPLTFARSQQQIELLEQLLGRRLGITSTFVAWDELFPNAGHRLDRAAGRTPLIAWYTRGDLAAIRSGRWDGLLERRARACREFGAPLYLRWAAEFNGDWNPCYGRGPDFVAAWRHMVGVFRAAGATNVRWVWCPIALEQRFRAAEDWRNYYPGDRFVDLVGMDGYNWGTARSWSRWQSFEAIFGPLYADYAGRKPIMICEIGSAEVGGDKSAWIRAMGTSLGGRFLRVRALVLFHANKETDWRVNSSDSALRAFRAVVADGRFGA
jgi:Glycosyl hydrolase family 26